MVYYKAHNVSFDDIDLAQVWSSDDHSPDLTREGIEKNPGPDQYIIPFNKGLIRSDNWTKTVRTK
jgi:hypothetical protein